MLWWQTICFHLSFIKIRQQVRWQWKGNHSKYDESFEKKIAKEISERGLCFIEGKEHISFKCYQKTCQLLMKEGPPVLCFLYCDFLFSQMIRENDHLKIYFPKHKLDQIGLNKEEARHIYSNAKDPAVCPLWGLASYLLVHPQLCIDAKKIFSL